MSRTIAQRACTLVCIVIGAVLLAGPGVLAADSNRFLDSGFWWRGNTGVGTPITPPDVARGELLAEAGPTGATSIIAIRGQLADGEGNPTLTLGVKSAQGASTAVVLACQAGAGWTGTHAGRFDDAPPVDCDTGAVQGIPSDDGTSWSFPIGPLQFADQFNVVLTAGANPANGQVAPFRIVFEAPADEGITTVAGAPPPAPPTTTTPTTTAVAPPVTQRAPAFSPPTTAARSTFTPPPPVPTNTPSVSADPVISPVAPAVPESQQGQTLTAPILTAQSAPILSVSSSVDTGRLRLFGLAMLLVGTATGLLWWRNDAAVPLRAVVSGVDAEMLERLQEAHAGEIEGGLGRFRTVRKGEAPRLF